MPKTSVIKPLTLNFKFKQMYSIFLSIIYVAEERSSIYSVNAGKCEFTNSILIVNHDDCRSTKAIKG